MKHLAIAFVFLLGACSFIPGLEADATPSQRLLGLEANYGAVFVVAAQYEGLPRCETHPTATVCSKQDVVDRMRNAHAAAKKSFDLAWATLWDSNASPTTVESAIAAAKRVAGNAMDLFNSYKSVVQ